MFKFLIFAISSELDKIRQDILYIKDKVHHDYQNFERD